MCDKSKLCEKKKKKYRPLYYNIFDIKVLTKESDQSILDLVYNIKTGEF